MARRPKTYNESNAPDLNRVSEKAEQVGVALSFLVEMDFAGHFRLGELDYDSVRQFCRRPGPVSSSSDSWD